MWLLAVAGYIAGMIGMRQLIRFFYNDPASRREYCDAAQFCVVFWPAGVLLISINALLISIGIVSDWLEKWIFD